MNYLSVAETAKKWNISERSVRNYCAQERIPGAVLIGKTWHIPENAEKPARSNGKKTPVKTLLSIMFETNTIGVENEVLNVDDVIETSNHFRCIDLIIDHAASTLSEHFIKKLHHILKTGTSDSRKDWFAVGEYKRLPNEVGGMQTSLPEEVADRMKALLSDYNAVPKKTLDDILDFHVRFERIHPFQDGNGRVGRLIMFKECLKYNIVPFIIEENLKLFYYRGLKKWYNEKGYLTDTCLTAQDKYKAYLDYFRIPYEK